MGGPALQLGVNRAPTILLVLTPFVVSFFGLGILSTGLLLFAIFLINFFITFASLKATERFQLETFAASPYAEHVRWCLDMLNEPYDEIECVGIVGVLFWARLLVCATYTLFSVDFDVDYGSFIFKKLGIADGSNLFSLALA